MRDIEFQHLQLRLQEAEAAAKIATPTDEASAAVQTQVDPPTPTSNETITGASATLRTQQLQLSTQLARPASPSLQDPEFLFQEDEETGTTSSHPFAKRLATELTTPTSASMEGATYPPVHHGTTFHTRGHLWLVPRSKEEGALPRRDRQKRAPLPSLLHPRVHRHSFGRI